jgi:cytochrome P450
MVDTVVSDGERSYLLKKDSVVQLPATVTHVSTATWGPDAASFNPRRFLKSDSQTTDQQRQQRRALMPFGGGRNLCPGRHFAYAEIVGMAAVMAVGCKTEGIRVPGNSERRVKFADGAYRPIGSALTMGAKISRREGWEDVVWSFTTGGEKE